MWKNIFYVKTVLEATKCFRVAIKTILCWNQEHLTDYESKLNSFESNLISLVIEALGIFITWRKYFLHNLLKLPFINLFLWKVDKLENTDKL